MGDFILGSVGVVGDVTGVKGDKEVSYRSGNVNLTPANIGALDVDNVYNGLDKTAAGYVLDARQGKALNDKINATQSDIAIIIDGNQTTHTGGVAVGEYVIVRNSTISGITDGVYKAVQAIPANTAIDSTYLEAVDGGGLNALNASIPLNPSSRITIISGTNTEVTLTETGWYRVAVQGTSGSECQCYANNLLLLASDRNTTRMQSLVYLKSGTKIKFEGNYQGGALMLYK